MDADGSDQWQAQPPPQQPPPDGMADAVTPGADRRPKTESLRMTSELVQAGQATAVPAPATYFSNAF